MENKTLCLLCNSKHISTIKTPKGSFLRCRDCCVIFLDPKHSLGDEEAYYSEKYYTEEFTGRADTSVFRYRLPLLFSFIPVPARLLEVGAASGDFLALLREYGYDVFGVELSKRAVEVALNRYDISLEQGDLRGAHYPNDTYDAVMMYHVLEYVPDPQDVLKEIHRILKKGGKLVIEVPNPSSVDAKISKHLKGSIYDYPNHSFLFPPKLLEKLVEAAGFKVSYLETSFSYALAEKLQKLRRGLRRRTSNEMSREKTEQSKLSSVPKFHESFFKKVLRRIFPGMKITCIAVKK